MIYLKAVVLIIFFALIFLVAWFISKPVVPPIIEVFTPGPPTTPTLTPTPIPYTAPTLSPYTESNYLESDPDQNPDEGGGTGRGGKAAENEENEESDRSSSEVEVRATEVGKDETRP
ncbi:MAG: hypothetical protein Fur0022_11100 [Anaerolineales bacterium]